MTHAGALPPDGRIGRVRLRVRDLGREVEFYERVLGLRAISRAGGEARLAAGGAEPALLVLVEDRGAPARPPRATGLFHFALLVPGRRDLAAALLHIRSQGWPFQGFADHAVSEALYLADPEGNGIEVYADRPRSAWTWRGGEVHMTTDALDLDSLLAAAGPGAPWTGLAAGTVMGHVHLAVDDLDAAEAFYGATVGLETTVRSYPGARFLSAGGYHHHVAVNVWGGARARPPAGALGLIDFEVVVPDAAARAALRDRLAATRFEDLIGVGVLAGPAGD